MDFSRSETSIARRYGGLGGIAALHAVVGYALIFSLAHKVVEPARIPLDVKLIKEIKIPPPKLELRPPAVKATAPPLPFIPPPEVPPNQQVAQDATIAAFSKEAVAAAPMAKPVEAPPDLAQSGPLPKARAHANWDTCMPGYPPTSMRLEEEGTVRIQFEVGPDDQLKEATMLKSSGYTRLDKAALKALSACSFKAGMRDGKTIASTLIVDYVWTIGGRW